MRSNVFLLAMMAVVLATAAIAGLGSHSRAQTAAPPADPQLLSEWGQVYVEDGYLRLAEGVEPYALNTALFTDYAHKLRTISVPAGAQINWNGDDVLDFPVGTVITKTFFYPRVAGEGDAAVARTQDRADALGENGVDLSQYRLMETRVLVRREDGWRALPYLWNEDQTEARLARIGAIEPLTLVSDDGAREDFAYVVPNQTQCASCHATNSNTRALSPIGPRPRHLNRDFAYADGAENQLDRLMRLGLLAGAPSAAEAPRAADAFNADQPLEARARAYLDINCAHCHSEVGPADTSGLHLGPATAHNAHLGLCKPPIAAGSGSGGRRFAIAPGAPESSILLFRMESTDPGAMMPELGRSTVHAEGVALIRDWISGLDGDCE